ENIARFTAHVPDALWGDLIDQGLLRPDALGASLHPEATASPLTAALAPSPTLTNGRRSGAPGRAHGARLDR
ncbi:MAG: hypothetical protein KKH75_03295, partial [Actinobacteria bacterium]|nr:hypothetical protein [Actinomycetota bacterium]